MPKADVNAIEPRLGCNYPEPFDEPCRGSEIRNVAKANGLSDFNANYVSLPPGCQSSQRHWHENEDELVVVLTGTVVLIDEHGRHEMRAGEVATFPKGDGNGHMMVNESAATCVLLAIGRPQASKIHYSDIDLIWTPQDGQQHRDGTPYPRSA